MLTKPEPSELRAFNRWWDDPLAISLDEKIIEFEEKQYKWKPDLPSYLPEPGNIYSLRGPRQLGKSTLVKLIIRDLLLQKKQKPKSIFYWSCENVKDFRELINLIGAFLDFKDANQITEAYIFLDEISFVQEWQRGIKSLAEQGRLKNCALLLTGSDIVDIRKSTERLPGRTGKKGKDFILLPFSFREFVALVDPGLHAKLPAAASLESLELIRQNAEAAKEFEKELSALFSKYLISGGFPLVINEFFSHGHIDSWVDEIYYRWVMGDLAKRGKAERLAHEIIRTVIKKRSSVFSWDSITKDVEIKSHLTVSSYIENLEQLFVFFVSYFFDAERKGFNFNKNKKIHFIDPFIYRVFCKRTNQSEDEAQMVEDVVAANLYKWKLKTGPFGPVSPVAYTSTNRETDIVLEDGGTAFGIEVKYQNKIAAEDWAPVSRFRRGLLLTKSYYSSRKMGGKMQLALPVPVFLALL
ncbi:MAG: ATP-binding protein [Candidatus Micrarchaeota archaeon]